MLHTPYQKFIGLDEPLIEFSDNPIDRWTLRDAVRGTQVFGSIGSGKTSGSGRTTALSFLENDFGGLVLCAKPDERENWEKMAAKANRTKDLIIFEEGSPFIFNPFDYETTRKSKGGGDSYNLVSLFMNIYQMGRTFNGEGIAKEGERFWDNALKRCIKRMVDLLRLANLPVSVKNMHKLLLDSGKREEVDKIMNIISEDTNTIEQLSVKTQKVKEIGNFYGICINAVINSYATANKEKIEQLDWELKLITNYFNREFAHLAPKTKTIIIESFLGMAEPFFGGILKKHFSGQTTPEIKPETCFDGKIIILDFPIKNYMEAGIYAQGIYKLIWQQVMERRKFKAGIDRPVFLWVDEHHMFISSYDQIFQSTARSCGACTVFLSQNISNYYAALGGKDPKPKVDSLLANLSTKIFHANNDAVTNEWAARTIGKDYKIHSSFSFGKEESFGGRQEIQNQINPVTFTRLKTGGKPNNFKVEAILTVAGKVWSDDNNFQWITIPQNI